MASPGKHPKVILEIVLYALTGILFAGIFFRQIVFSHFDLLYGNASDSRFNGVILEHWWQVLHGNAHWLSPTFFYPVQRVLGYSDAGALYALPYVVLRFMGIDPFASCQIVLFALVAAGWVGMAVFLRCCLKLSPLPTIVGTALFVFPNSMATSSANTQLLTICFLPYLAIAFYVLLQPSAKPAFLRPVAGVFLAIMVPAIFYTSYYIGWFSVFYVLLLSGVCYAWTALHSGGNAAWARILRKRVHWRALLPYCALSAICSIPFLLTYIPVFAQFGGRDYQEIAPREPSLVDYVNVGPNNWLWGEFLSSNMTGLDSRFAADELTKGVPFCSLVIYLAFVVYFIRRIRHHELTVSEHGICRILVDGKEADRDDRLEMLATGLGVTVLLAWVLMLKIGDRSLWWLVVKLVPGASGIRVVYRFQHVLAFPLAIVVAAGLHEFIRHAAGRSRSRVKRGTGVAVFCVLCLLIVVEQFNSGSLANYSKQEEENMLAGISPPPQQARVFALLPARGLQSTQLPYQAQVDAMIIAQKYGLYTINGYSGQFPPGWGGISAIEKPSYMWALDRWIQDYKLEGDQLYLLDRQTGAWLASLACRLTLPYATDADLAELKDRQDIVELNLSHSKVTDRGLTCLNGMTRLRELYLGGTAVTDAGLTNAKELQSLETLRLGDTKVTDAGLKHLKEMKGLMVLDLSRTQVTDAAMAQLKGMQNLQMLVMGDTNVTDAGLAQLQEMRGLEVLMLAGTGVTDAGLAHLKGMQSLQVLALSDTKVTDVGIAQLAELRNLRELYLGSTRVTDAGLAQLKRMASLLYIDLSNTRVTSAGLADLKAALPNTQIQR